MAKLFIKNLGIEIEAEEGEKVLDVLTKNQIYVDSPCGGLGICEKCRVRVNGKEVLACTSKVEGDAFLEIKEEKPNFTVLREDREADKEFGLAFDIGTTTILSALTGMDGNPFFVAATENPQRVFGTDIITRIYRSTTEGMLETFKEMLIKKLNEIAESFFQRLKLKEKEISSTIVVGNPTMLHIFLGIDPFPLGIFPYIPKFKGGLIIDARSTGLSFSGLLYIPPFPSGFIGADVMTGLLFSEFHKKSLPSLYMDLGTNGEIVLNDGKNLVACSVPAGPAFEGGSLSCGMRAEKGAIERVWLEGDIKLEVIGNVNPLGICGSGFISAVSEMLKKGILMKDGKFSEAIPHPFDKYFEREKKAFYLWRGEKDVFITQKDIREFQLAKSAVQSGIKILLKKTGIKLEDINEIIITGGFGKSIDTEAFLSCRFMPPGFRGNIKFIETSALNGAFLLIKKFESARNELENIISKLETVELAMNEEFEKIFLESMEF